MLAAKAIDSSEVSRWRSFVALKFLASLPAFERTISANEDLSNGVNTIDAMETENFKNQRGNNYTSQIKHRNSQNWGPSFTDMKTKFLGSIPRFVKIVEVGPGDGLQNEKSLVPTGYCCEAVADGAKEVAIFAAASESFSRLNINCSIKDSLARYSDVALAVRNSSIPVCGSRSGVSPSQVVYVVKELLNMGCAEISLGDMIGVGTSGTVVPMLEAITEVVPLETIFMTHMGMLFQTFLCHRKAECSGLRVVSSQTGIRTVDSAVSGLGGCPYAKRASGNIATEDVVVC